MKIERHHFLIVTVVLILSGAAWLGLADRRARASQPTDSSVQPVAVILAERKPLASSVTLSGEFRPFQEVDVHAKVAGYIRKIYVDVGDRVKTGQTLAILEVPELNAQLQGADAAVRRARDAIRRAQGDMDRGESLHAAIHLDYNRLKQASEARPGLIAEQELDDAQAKDKEGEAQIASDEAALSEARNQLDISLAEQKQLSAMSDYTRITAPFAGIVTRRYVDTGALVQAGDQLQHAGATRGQRRGDGPVPADAAGAGIGRSLDSAGQHRDSAGLCAGPELRRQGFTLR